MACILVCAEVSVSIMMVVRRRAVADISFLFSNFSPQIMNFKFWKPWKQVVPVLVTRYQYQLETCRNLSNPDSVRPDHRRKPYLRASPQSRPNSNSKNLYGVFLISGGLFQRSFFCTYLFCFQVFPISAHIRSVPILHLPPLPSSPAQCHPRRRRRKEREPREMRQDQKVQERRRAKHDRKVR